MQCKASTTLSLDLCPLPHLNLQGYEMEMQSCPLMVIILKSPLKIHVVKDCCEIEIIPVPPHFS